MDRSDQIDTFSRFTQVSRETIISLKKYEPDPIRVEPMINHHLIPTRNVQFPKNCGEIKSADQNAKSGRYMIYPEKESSLEAEVGSTPYDSATGVSVWCNMEHEEVAGNRKNPKQSRKWSTKGG